MKKILFWWWIVFLLNFVKLNIGEDSGGCPNRVFLGCILRLKAQRVPFEKNMLNLIFNIGSEARLMHTCKAYGDVMPCFRDRILECGNDRQRRMLNEVGKALMFLCSPFSMERQRVLIKNQKCISEILALPATVGCQLQDTQHGRLLLRCREVCATRPSDFICMMKSWISEQNVCTLRDILNRCGAEAADFYTDLQSTVFEPLFPVLCDLPPDTVVDMNETVVPIASTVRPETTTTKLKRITDVSPKNVDRENRRSQSSFIKNEKFNSIRGLPKKNRPDIEKVSFMPRATVDEIAPYEQNYAFTDKYGYSIKMNQSRESTTPRSIAILSLFQKLLPSSFSQKMPGFFQNTHTTRHPDNNLEESNEVVSITENLGGRKKPQPIGAKESYELQNITPLIQKRINRFLNMSTSEPYYVNSDTTLDERYTSTMASTSTPTQQPFYTFTSKARSKQDASTIESSTSSVEKWRPWYYGGYDQVQFDQQFLMPLYNGD